MSEQNKAAFRAIPEKVINLGKFDTADQYFAQLCLHQLLKQR